MTIVSETVYYFGRNYTIQELSLTYDEADRLLIKLRDEAHRFANAYRKIQHQREWK